MNCDSFDPCLLVKITILILQRVTVLATDDFIDTGKISMKIKNTRLIKGLELPKVLVPN